MDERSLFGKFRLAIFRDRPLSRRQMALVLGALIVGLLGFTIYTLNSMVRRSTETDQEIEQMYRLVRQVEILGQIGQLEFDSESLYCDLSEGLERRNLLASTATRDSPSATLDAMARSLVVNGWTIADAKAERIRGTRPPHYELEVRVESDSGGMSNVELELYGPDC